MLRVFCPQVGRFGIWRLFCGEKFRSKIFQLCECFDGYSEKAGPWYLLVHTIFFGVSRVPHQTSGPVKKQPILK